MKKAVLTAVPGGREDELMSVLAVHPRLNVVRRCVDLPELLATARSGVGDIVVLSDELPRLDRETIAELRSLGLQTVAWQLSTRDDALSTLHAWGVDRVLTAETGASMLVRALESLIAVAKPVGSAAPTSSLMPEAEVDPVMPPPSDPTSGSFSDLFDSGEPTRNGSVIAVWGPVGAPGRTSVAVGLATELTSRGDSCLLVDADTRGASVAVALGMLDEYSGLVAAVRAAAAGPLTPRRLVHAAPEVVTGLRVLTGIAQPHRWPELRPASLNEVWRVGRKVAQWTVVDVGADIEDDGRLRPEGGGARRFEAGLSALESADLVIAVAAAEPMSIQRLVRGLREVRQVVGEVDIRVVVTKVRGSAIGDEFDIRALIHRFLGEVDVVCIPDDRDNFDAAMMSGRTLAEIAPSSPARIATHSFARALRVEFGLEEAGETKPARWSRLRRLVPSSS